mgnify:CR=1 FL=1
MKKIIVLLLVLCFLIACVPTPDEEVIINRADGALEQAIVEEPVDPYVYEAPNRWDEAYEVREQKIQFSADIEFPNTEEFPVKTIKQRLFDNNDVISFLTSFRSGNWLVRENEYSREELMVDLKNAAKGDYMGEDEETGEPIWVPNEAEMQRIQKLIEQTPAQDSYAPLTPERLTFPIKKISIKDDTDVAWYLFANEKRTQISLMRYRDGNIQMENWVMQGEATPGEPPHTLDSIQISEDDAVTIGDDIILKLGLTDYKVADIKKAREVQSYTYEVYGEGYWLTYVQTLPGAIPCYYGDYVDPDFLNFTQGDMTYAPPWKQEHIQMFITENGVLFLSWNSPKETILLANRNVQLMPFNDIQKSIKRLLEYGTGGHKGSPIIISRVVLTTAIAQIPNQGEEAFLIPTWAVFLTSEQNENMNIDMGVLLINALDGTYIDRFNRDDGLPDRENP